MLENDVSNHIKSHYVESVRVESHGWGSCMASINVAYIFLIYWICMFKTHYQDCIEVSDPGCTTLILYIGRAFRTVFQSQSEGQTLLILILHVIAQS